MRLSVKNARWLESHEFWAGRMSIGHYWFWAISWTHGKPPSAFTASSALIPSAESAWGSNLVRKLSWGEHEDELHTFTKVTK